MVVETDEKKYIEHISSKLGEENKPVEVMREEFIQDFNKEARMQGSDWKAEIIYGHLHVSKFKESGFWIFKSISRIEELHIGCYEHRYSFVDNDYLISNYGKTKSDAFFKLLPEFKPILEAIPQFVFILTNNSLETMNRKINDITDTIRNIKREVKK